MGAGTSPADPARAGDRPGGGDAEGASREGGSPQAGSPGADPGAGSADADSGNPAARNGTPGSGALGGAEPASAEPSDAGPGGSAPPPRKSRRFPLFTRDTARPEGGGRAAPGDAPAPARQWPLLSVISAAGVGLLIVALDPFAEAFRIGIILIGAALIAGAVLRWLVPSVGMLAVRSRFTDLVTYGLMGTLIVLLALVAQPRPWLDVPILEDAVRFTIR